MQNKLRIAVLLGGPSAEYEVSLKTGKMVAENLDPERYTAQTILISKRGKWPISLATLKDNFDLAFIAMHGEYGEDGTIQAVLEHAKIPFTGSGSHASKLGMDKAASARVFAKAGLAVPQGWRIKNRAVRFGKYPIVIKPADLGSSVGVSIVKTVNELLLAIELAFKHSKSVLAQQFIAGREFTCGVLEIDAKLRALPPTEIIPKASSFFDFAAKYTAGASQEITPPNLPPAKIKRLQQIALKAHKALGCRGFSRTDIIMDKTGKMFVLEINTIPGMTSTSLLPQQAAAAGISFPELLDIIVRGAMRSKK